MEDVIAKHCPEVTFAHAESQTSYATLNVTIVYRVKIMTFVLTSVVLVLRLSKQFLFYIYIFFMRDILNVKNTNKKHLSNIEPNIFISDKISEHSTKCVYKQCNN